MIWTALALVALPLALGEIISRSRHGAVAAALAVAAMVALAVAGAAQGQPGPVVVGLLGAATVLSRPPTWREPREIGHLAETALLVGAAFAADEPLLVIIAWLASFLPGLRRREHEEVSRRSLLVLAVLSSLPVGLALGMQLVSDAPGARAVGYLGLVIGGMIRMGVAPFSPLLMASYDRLPLGRTALVAAVRPSVPLILAARAAYPEQVSIWAGALETWAALAAVATALAGLAQHDPRRSIGAMAATQAAIVACGLASPVPSGIEGALVQWAGLGISIVGLGLLVEATESRLGRYRARTVRGLIGPTPGSALLFLLFAATMAGFPGTSGFAGEDLVLRASAHHGPVLPVLLLAATALNGCTMLLMFSRTFLGPLPAEARGLPPLVPRERLASGALVLGLAAITLWPGVLAP